MSSTVEFVVVPTLFPQLLLALSAAAAVVGAGAAAYGAYKLIDQLQKDYQHGVADFHARSDADAQHRRELSQQNRRALEAALALVGRTKVEAAVDANRQFLLSRMKRMSERLAPLPDPSLLTQCRELRAAIEESTERLAEHLEAYRLLADAASAALANLPAVKTNFAEEISALREEIESLLEAPEMRAELLAQLDALRRLSARQRAVARQGLSLLRQRVYREIATRAELQQARAREAAERRALVGEIFAKLQAVSQQVELPDFVIQAAAHQQRLGEILTAGGTRELVRLRQLAEEAAALFSTCEHMLQERLVSSFISDQVADVLLSLGYQVKQLANEPESHDFVAPIEQGVAIKFHVEDGGRVGSEMVALSSEAVDADAEAQEKICAIVDRIIGELGARNLAVRERFRASLQPGEKLHVVEVVVEEEAAPRSAVKPKRKKVGE